jgi:hypothetical protein
MGKELAPKTYSSCETSRLDDSLFSKDLSPHYMQLAGKLSASELVPKCYRGKPADLFICWAKGYQLGIPPEQAMDCISVINGKAVMWGDEMLALCMAHPDFEDIVEEPLGHPITGFRCTVKRYGMEPKSNEFTLEMAKRAGLLGKVGPWTQYPERMLKLRARGFTLRDTFPDALKGIKSREEVEDYTVGEYEPIEAKSSRTEALVADIKSKHGDRDDIREANGLVEDSSHREDPEGASVLPEGGRAGGSELEVGGLGAGEVEARAQVKKLIEERGVPQERVDKALAYYEAGSIDELSQEAALDFIHKIEKTS